MIQPRSMNQTPSPRTGPGFSKISISAGRLQKYRKSTSCSFFSRGSKAEDNQFSSNFLNLHFFQEENRPLRNKRRPLPAPFDLDRIKAIGGEVTNDGDFYIFESSHYRRGFLYKAFPMNSIIVDGVRPSLTELEHFQDSAEDLKKECK
ncbi:unnamed protein product [Meloidogyne enterolobii]|uniref:Uncharacterized protein n=1 Tax=Meloidogyne enterolobii TaxID=390850 RepID=A0ACB1A202_MELEN